MVRIRHGLGAGALSLFFLGGGRLMTAEEAARPAAGEPQGARAEAPRAAPGAGAPEGSKRAEKAEAREKARLFREAVEGLRSAGGVEEMTPHLETLGRGFPASRAVVVEAAGDRSSRVRAFAMKLLGEHGEGEKDLAVVARGLEDHGAAVRMAAVMALRRFGAAAWRPAAERLARETEPNIRKMLAKNLELAGDPGALPFLTRAIEREEHDGVRKFLAAAIAGLGKKEGAKAADPLLYVGDAVSGEERERLREYVRLLREGARAPEVEPHAREAGKEGGSEERKEGGSP
jgi:hypothetical protein